MMLASQSRMAAQSAIVGTRMNDYYYDDGGSRCCPPYEEFNIGWVIAKTVMFFIILSLMLASCL